MKTKITNGCTHAHKLTFENGSSTIVHCSGKNIISPNPGQGWQANQVYISGNVTFGSTDGSFKVNGDIMLHDYPPTVSCGNITNIEYLGEVSEY